MNLVLAARSERPLEELARHVKAAGSVALVQPSDVINEMQCKKMIASAIEQFGTIHYLIANAGMSMWSRFDQIKDLSIFRKLMEINYLGVVNCIHPALPHLKKSHGTIVVISSAQAVIGVPEHTGYTATKHALRGFLEALELEIGDQVHILQVMPGWVRDTNLRARAFNCYGTAIGESKRKHDKQSVSPQQCADRIVKAMQGRRRDLYIPSKLQSLLWLKLIAPKWLRSKIKRSVDTQG